MKYSSAKYISVVEHVMTSAEENKHALLLENIRQ